jgi:hypothetical protein
MKYWGGMNRSFIRGVWGIYDKDGSLGKPYSRRTKIDNDIALAKLNPYESKFRVYIFGEENYKRVTDMGYDTVLIDKKPICWDMKKEQYRHKIEIWKYGLMDFDQVVFLDWDCVPVQPIPKNFWDILEKGPKIQATLYMYRLRRLSSRTHDERKLSASTFVYMREKNISEEIIKVWESMGRPWQEEVALSQYIDNLDGGWKGIENYKKYEPAGFHSLFHLYKDFSFLKERLPIFYHLNHRIVSSILSGKTTEGIKKILNDFYNSRSKGIKSLLK